MKYRPIIPLYLLLILMIIFQFSCAKDSDLIAEFIIEENLEDLSGIELENALQIPSDFDWTNIPEDYANTVWKITESFDLKGASIGLPEGVTLYFNGGELTNGTLTGSKTLIASQGSSQVFDAVSLTGTFENEYIMPYWFGAVMDGVTDDRDAFVATLAQANTLGLKVLVEKNIFLDVEETGTKSIFFEDNTWIEGANDIKIIYNNLYSPAFIIALSKNVTIKNIEFLYDQTYDAKASPNDSGRNALNITQINRYLTTHRNITLTQTNNVWRGPSLYMATLLIEAATGVNLENVKFKAKGETADTFIPWVIKFKEQYTTDQTVTNGVGDTDVTRDVKLTNITIDGAIMGIQGIVQDFVADGIKSLRYSDVQSSDGSNVGGVDNWMPPPHLFYLNDDNSTSYHPDGIKILNVVDLGDYVGTKNVRTVLSGYCNSLKLVGHVENVVVDNYKSYRRDGLGDLGGINNGVFKNIYAESTVGIFDPSFQFSSLRSVGSLTNVSFDNMTIKDNTAVLEIYPLSTFKGDYVTMDNVHVYVNELNTKAHGPFGISGSNNRVVNSSLTIKKHTSTQDYSGVIYHDNVTLDTGKNNSYDILINGWRSIAADPIKKSTRVLLANSINTNTNFAKITDAANNFTIEQNNAIKKDTWTRTEVVTLGDGNSQLLDISIPSGFTVQKITAKTLKNLASGIEVSIGTESSQKDNLLSAVSKTIGSVSNTLNEATMISGFKNIYLFANGDFNQSGSIEVTLALVRISEY